MDRARPKQKEIPCVPYRKRSSSMSSGSRTTSGRRSAALQPARRETNHLLEILSDVEVIVHFGSGCSVDEASLDSKNEVELESSSSQSREKVGRICISARSRSTSMEQFVLGRNCGCNINSEIGAVHCRWCKMRLAKCIHI